MNLRIHLSLGRVSNLPTVLTNVLVAGALAGVTFPSNGWLPLASAMCIFYIAGMYYNDVCDAEYDREHQTHRPIAAGLISRERVEAFAIGYTCVASLLVYVARMQAPLAQGSGSAGWLVSTLTLITCIVIYDRHHKHNRFSPVIMAACRLSVLLTSSYTLSGTLPPPVLGAMLAMFCWLIGLTYFAKHEQNMNLETGSHRFKPHWALMLLCLPLIAGVGLGTTTPAVFLPLGLLCWVVYTAHTLLTHGPSASKGRAIALLIAGICLIDGIFLAWVWGISGALAAIVAFGLTLFLQRWVAGT